ncbi:unnamed protein product [Adineta steineri]|uniref:Uncharacterized protein n=1 Tax=Adineta steineri TaxID=433720 RepID=A0A816F540_9BILA|nr:unnamed protein product [Adineta steineri]CAF1656184.1 unnamed protein product [Adineta steineri]
MADNKQNESTDELNPSAAELEKETMLVRVQLVEQQQQARTCTDPQQQAICATAVVRTAHDLLDTEKEWKDKREEEE